MELSWTVWLLLGTAAWGFYTWGEGFFWVVLGFVFCRNILWIFFGRGGWFLSWL